jgi:hypothetical protein
LGEFGIEVSKYFTLSDYIASSIEGIRYSASGAVIAAIGFFIGVRSSSGASLDQLELQKKKMVYPMGFLLFTSIFGSVYTYYYNFEAFFVSFYALIVVSANILSVQGIVNRYFKQPLIASFLIVFLCTFAGHMFMSIGRTIYDLKNKKLEEIKTYDLIFKEQIPLQSSKMVLIAANSNFLFLLDEDKNAFIVPKDQILYVMKRAPWKKP